MADISLKVSIAGRSYPLTVKEEDKERVNEMARTINEKVKDFEQNYFVHDKQDLLAMCAINLLTYQKETPDKSHESDLEELNQLNLHVSDYLQKEQL